MNTRTDNEHIMVCKMHPFIALWSDGVVVLGAPISPLQKKINTNSEQLFQKVQS